MDEKLLKKSVQSIEMPEDMKYRIIANCKSGEAKPLILPKKRFVYMPIAAAACVCLLTAAAVGVGAWQLGGLGEGGGDVVILPENSSESSSGFVDLSQPADTSGKIINIIPLTAEDVLAGKTVVSVVPGDFEPCSDEWQIDYYGIDLRNLPGMPSDMVLHEGPADPNGRGFYAHDLREPHYVEEVYYDLNTYLYTSEPYGDRSFQISVSKLGVLGIPDSIEKLWSDKTMLSFINGTKVAIGSWDNDGRTVYEAEFETLTGTTAGTCFHIRAVAGIEELTTLIYSIIEQSGRPDYIKPLTLEKLIEICSDDPSKLSWSDFQGYDCMEIGSGLYILQYPIGDKYTLTIGGAPESEPYYMEFHADGQYYSIDLREGGLEDYLNEPIPEGDVINVIPITWDDINNGELSSETDFVEGDQVYMTDEQLSDYYGIDITAFGNIPSDMVLYSYQGTPGGESRHIWRSNGGAGDIYYDRNAFYYAAPDGSRSIMITVGTLPNYIEKLWKDQKMLSRINGKTVAIGQTEDGYYNAEFTSADSWLGFEVSGMGVSIEELCGVIAALVEQSQ